MGGSGVVGGLDCYRCGQQRSTQPIFHPSAYAMRRPLPATRWLTVELETAIMCCVPGERVYEMERCRLTALRRFVQRRQRAAQRASAGVGCYEHHVSGIGCWEVCCGRCRGEGGACGEGKRGKTGTSGGAEMGAAFEEIGSGRPTLTPSKTRGAVESSAFNTLRQLSHAVWAKHKFNRPTAYNLFPRAEAATRACRHSAPNMSLRTRRATRQPDGASRPTRRRHNMSRRAVLGSQRCFGQPTASHRQPPAPHPPHA